MLHLKAKFKVKGVKRMLTIGSVARQAGVRPSVLRYYEAQGILRPAARRPNGYRIYSDDALRLLLFVRRAQTLGITLKEIKPLVNLASHGQQPCSQVKQVARRHLNEVSQKIRELELLRQDLRALLKRKAGRPHAYEICPLIEGT
jgi:MerR family transcriptional regulator, copper efflux regulator